VKRTALLLLTSIYLLSCLGIGLNRFYCCGKLASVKLIYGATENAGKETGKKDNCCKNEQSSLKIKDTHFSITAFSLNQPVPAIIASFISLNNEAVVKDLQTKIAYNSNAPPGCWDIPIYTLNCAYRI
jgi:hypothetical protein